MKLVAGVRVAIVTFVHGSNYGCFLQRYALQQSLKLCGKDAVGIVFTPNRLQKQRCFNRFWRLGRIWCALQLKINKCACIIYGAGQRKRRAFNDLSESFLNSTSRFRSYDELVQNIPKLNFDAYIAGSDQIWNTAWMPTEEIFRYYMLDFAPSDKKIAYAPSVGVSGITDKLGPKFQRYWADFRFLSGARVRMC